jgi:hypothetical protein
MDEYDEDEGWSTPSSSTASGPPGSWAEESPVLNNRVAYDASIERHASDELEDSPIAADVKESLNAIGFVDEEQEPATPLYHHHQEQATPLHRSRRRAAPLHRPHAGVRRDAFAAYDSAEEEEEAEHGQVHLIAPGTASPALFNDGGGFVIYADSPVATGGFGGAVRLTGLAVARRQAPSLTEQARRFLLKVVNVKASGRATKPIFSQHPAVDESGLLQGGRCRITWNGGGTPLGVIVLDKALLPKKPATRAGSGDELLRILPVFVTPSSEHMTLVLPSVRPDKLADHFVVQLLHASGRSLVRLAIAKVVLVSLLFVNSAQINFYSVPISATMTISVTMRVSQMRRHPETGALLVALDRVEWFVPEGFAAGPDSPAPKVTKEDVVVAEHEWSEDIEAAYLASAIAVVHVPK